MRLYTRPHVLLCRNDKCGDHSGAGSTLFAGPAQSMPAGSAAVLCNRPTHLTQRSQGSQQAAPGSCAGPAQQGITAVIRRQQHMDSILVYLDEYGEQISSIDFKGAADLTPAATLRELPPGDRPCSSAACTLSVFACR